MLLKSKMRLSASSRPLHDGDIVNIDITVYLNGFHGDTSQTFLVGNVVRVAPSHHSPFSSP
jgi:methionine aminopeptidase